MLNIQHFFTYRAFFRCSEITPLNFFLRFLTDFDILTCFRILEVGAVKFFWKMRYLDQCGSDDKNAAGLNFENVGNLDLKSLTNKSNIPHQKLV